MLRLILIMIVSILSCGIVEGQVASILVMQQPSGAIQRENLLKFPIISLFDSTGQPVTSDQRLLVESIPGQELIGKTSLQVVQGTANLEDLVFTRSGQYTLKFSMSGGSPFVESQLINVQAGFESFGLVCPRDPTQPILAVAGSTLTSNDCADASGFPEVSLLNSLGELSTNSHLPVFVSITDPAATLAGIVTDDSCCKHSMCSFLYLACCNCNDPACALCVVAKSGTAVFRNLRIDKVGQYDLRYTTTQFSLFNGTKTERSTVLPTFTKVDIIPGEATSLAVLVQPEESAIRGVQGDEPGLLNPQPKLIFSDDQQNPVSGTGSGRVLPTGCFDGSDTHAEVVEGLCKCIDVGCLKQGTLEALQEKSRLSFEGAN